MSVHYFGKGQVIVEIKQTQETQWAICLARSQSNSTYEPGDLVTEDPDTFEFETYLVFPTEQQALAVGFALINTNTF